MSKENIIVCGCGRLGASIAGKLSERGMNVTIIDKSADSFRKLPQTFSGYNVVADATNVDVLVQYEADKCDYFIVTTENDNINSFIGQIAAKLLNVPNVCVRLNNPDKMQIIKDIPNIKIILPYELAIEKAAELTGLPILGGDDE